MPPSPSAGLLVYRQSAEELEVILVHPGGPLWAKKDEGAWSIPKGEYEKGEDAEATALREFEEELGQPPPDGPRFSLGEIRQPSGKRVSIWAVQRDLDITVVTSNTFEMEWPPRSGQLRTFPEVDRAAWFTLAQARTKLVKGQVGFLDRLVEALAPPPS